jgi:hypothetical protein
LSNTYTTAIALAMPAANDDGWNTPLNGNAQLLDVLSPVGDFNCTLTEFPSASLNVKVAAGQFQRQDGTVITYAGTTSQAITAASTKVLYLDGTAAWALVVAATYPATPHIRIATVVAGATTITSITDNRQAFVPSGSFFDGLVFSIGTTTGLQIGSASTQKIGFLGAAPAVQQTGGAATASSSYTATEQGMLNKAYSALRTFGLLS